MGKFNIIIGDVTSDEILDGHDLIINPTNPRMLCGSGVSGAIFHKAGVNELENYTQSHYNINFRSNDNLMKVGEIRITPGFKLGMDIMFIQGPVKYEYENPEEILFDIYNRMLESIYKNGYKSILLVSLGTGTYGFKHQDVGKKVSSLLKKFVKDKDLDIDLVLYNESQAEYY